MKKYETTEVDLRRIIKKIEEDLVRIPPEVNRFKIMDILGLNIEDEITDDSRLVVSDRSYQQLSIINMFLSGFVVPNKYVSDDEMIFVRNGGKHFVSFFSKLEMKYPN